jgi:hypothetical protein
MAEPPLCLIVLASARGTKPAPAPPGGLIADHTTPEACCHESAPPIGTCRSPQTQGSATPVRLEWEHTLVRRPGRSREEIEQLRRSIMLQPGARRD